MKIYKIIVNLFLLMLVSNILPAKSNKDFNLIKKKFDLFYNKNIFNKLHIIYTIKILNKLNIKLKCEDSCICKDKSKFLAHEYYLDYYLIQALNYLFKEDELQDINQLFLFNNIDFMNEKIINKLKRLDKIDNEEIILMNFFYDTIKIITNYHNFSSFTFKNYSLINKDLKTDSSEKQDHLIESRYKIKLYFLINFIKLFNNKLHEVKSYNKPDQKYKYALVLIENKKLIEKFKQIKDIPLKKDSIYQPIIILNHPILLMNKIDIYKFLDYSNNIKKLYLLIYIDKKCINKHKVISFGEIYNYIKPYTLLHFKNIHSYSNIIKVDVGLRNISPNKKMKVNFNEKILLAI